MTAGEFVLSDRQFAIAGSLCASGRGLTLEALGTPAEVKALYKLGILEERQVGGLAPLYHLTSFGRELVCAHQDDDPDGRSYSGDPAGPLPKEVTMTDVKTDPKPSAKKRAPRKPKTTDAAVPAVEDVTDAPVTPATKPDLTPVFDVLLGKVQDLVGKDGVTEKKTAYTRVSLGKAVVYINNPTTRSVRVEVPEVDGPGYDVIKLTTDDLSPVMPLIEKRIEILKERAAAKVAAAA